MRSLVLCCLLFAANVMGKTADTPQLTAFFSAIIVEDMDRSIAWYQQNFGLTQVNRVDMMTERGFAQANLKRDGLQLELIQTNKTITPGHVLKDKPKKSKIGGFFKLGFQVQDFDAWIKRLESNKVEFYGSVVKDVVSGKRTVLLLDPDGNRLQLFEK